MAALVHLVRHGEVDNPDHVVYGFLAGFGLSPRGKQEAVAVARRLGAAPLGAVYSSPLERALQTAAEIARPLHLAVTPVPELAEWRLAERWQGYAWEELPWTFPGELEAYLEHPADLDFAPESLAELAARMAAVIEALADRHPEGELAVVSHQDPIQAGRLALTGRPLEMLSEDKPGHAAVITLRPGSPWVELCKWEPEGSRPFPPAHP